MFLVCLQKKTAIWRKLFNKIHFYIIKKGIKPLISGFRRNPYVKGDKKKFNKIRKIIEIYKKKLLKSIKMFLFASLKRKESLKNFESNKINIKPQNAVLKSLDSLVANK